MAEEKKIDAVKAAPKAEKPAEAKPVKAAAPKAEKPAVKAAPKAKAETAEAPEEKYENRLVKKYKSEIVPALVKEFGYSSVMPHPFTS